MIEAAKTLRLVDSIPTLRRNATRSKQYVRESRSFLRREVDYRGVPLDVVALGSIGRQEASASSDFDYLIIAYGLPENVTASRDLFAAVIELRENKLHLGKQGPTNLFGRLVSAPDLIEFIGLEDDSNRSLTHRMLILEEGVSLYRPDLHKTLIRKIIERYLADYSSPKPGVPRFLLNDILRYWRTIAVDYQAKRWEDSEGWGLRYLKLRISRKLAFAGSLVPLLLCRQNREAKVQYFVDQFSMPALARIAQLHTVKAFHKPLKTIFTIAEEFALKLSEAEFRDEAKSVKEPGDKTHWPPNFIKFNDRANDLQKALEQIFFASNLFGKNSKKYLSF